MSNNFGYIDIILLAMIAGFIILRLRNNLGKKTGNEDKGLSEFSEKRFEQFKKQTINKNDEIHKKGLVGIQREEILKGAEVAYETIITSFANSDIKKLKSLLSPKMFVNFEEAVLQKNKDNIKSELTFIGMKESKLEKFEEIKNEFFAIVKFVCEIISETNLTVA